MAEQKFSEDHGKPMLEHVYAEELESMKRTEAGAWEQREEEEAVERQLLCTYCSPQCAAQGGTEESGVKESTWALERRVGEQFL